MAPIQNNYRPEIDGLRAISVLGVLLYHAGFKVAPGGFFGVDVFFVISGYLITTILLTDLKMGQFSIAHFYERRARRILPALFLVLFCCIPFVWLWMLPMEVYRFAQALIGILVFCSNILFSRTTGYFTEGELQPLLHTWSLAVEEQFYLFFPILLALFWKKGLNWIRAVVFVFLLASFATYIWWHSQSQFNASFYLAPARIWQILVGVLVALYPVSSSKRSDNWLSLSGFVLVLFSMIFYPVLSKEPGWFSVVPTIGATLIIGFSKGENWIKQLLSQRCLVLVGLCSYSIYLWHQPIFTFAKIYQNKALTTEISIGLIVITLVISYFSYRFVETPFRNKHTFQISHILGFAGMGTIFFATLGFLGVSLSGFYTRLPHQALVILNLPDVSSAKCHAQLTGELIKAGSYCLQGTQGLAPSFALIGDSHAGALVQAFDEKAKARAQSFLVISEGWCVPFKDFVNPSHPPCESLINEGLQQIVKIDSIKVVILSAEWANYTAGFRYGSRPVAYQDAESNEVSVKNNPDVFARGLRRTVNFLKAHNKKVVVIGPIPEHPFDVKAGLARDILLDRSDSLQPVSLAEYRNRNSSALVALNSIYQEVNLVDASRLFCNEQLNTCKIVDENGLPLYSDGNHPSLLGARMLANVLF